VIYAGSNYTWRRPNGQVDRAYTYGNVIIIEHDFGWQGKRLYTLYAHLQVILPNIVENTLVRMGDVIGLSGDTGVVSGPHVHFEVRVEENWYYSTRNPILWMTPYEGHGVVAGRLLYANGRPVEDEVVYLTQNGKVIDTTTTYVNPKQLDSENWNVNSDEVWKETFAIGDVPGGNYTLYINANGIRFEQQISVQPGTTTFVDLGQVPIPGVRAPTPTAAP
jgi:murein DD-endopeptidase MepM/ murein hydrolase activator NlpD